MSVFKLNITNIIFVLLIPAYFFYIALNSFGVIGNFLGGYLPIMMSCSFVFLAFIYLRNFKTNIIDTVFIVFVLYSAVLVFFTAATSIMSQEELYFHISTILYSCVYFMLFKEIDYKSKIFNSMILISILAMIIIVLSSIVNGTLSLSTNLKYGASEEGLTNYQSLAVSFILCAAIYLNSDAKMIYKICISIICIVTLHFIGARSEFFAFIIILFSTGYLDSDSKIKYLLILLIMSIISILTILLLFQVEQFDLGHNRIVDLIMNGSQATSNLSRDVILDEGIEIIQQSIWFGDMNGYSEGRYIHNILSAWQDYGIIGFLIFLFLIGISLKLAVSLVLNSQKQNAQKPNLALSLLLYSVFLLLFSKTYGYLPFYASLGLLTREYKEDYN
ncbi:MAG: hypothetical protein COC24_010045 [Alphaproteobacteria bacterium]|nr:hypothetical protein [Alphaproteobacteria bacterium]